MKLNLTNITKYLSQQALVTVVLIALIYLCLRLSQ
jgi:hypothetical protein